MKLDRLAWIIVLLTLGAAFAAFHNRPKRGLDIQGGMRVVLEADTTKLPQDQKWGPDTKSAILKIIEKRVNANGVAEPSIAPKGEKQFVVEIPALRNKEQVLEQLQTTARLEFYYARDWKTNRNPIGRYDIKPVGGAGGRERYLVTDNQTGKTLRDPYHINLRLKEMIDHGAEGKPGTASVMLPPPLKNLSAAAGQPTAMLTKENAREIAELNEELKNFNQFLQGATLELTGNDLKPTAHGNFDPKGGAKPVVELEFNADGTRKFGDFTRDHTNEILMIYLDGQILMAPNIEVPIPDGRAVISPFPTLQDAQRLADFLNGGALPVPLKIVQQQSIEATLGRDAVHAGLSAGLIGLGAVLLFMVGYYLLPGAVACLALLLYTLFTYALFVLVPVTFTLPGIAGFILSVGMAVDANILIFERTKEELRAGKPLRLAIETGFQRAFSAIFDSNFCTAITSVLLYYFGTGPVRGFALTLLLGVAVSMFTAITVTRTILLLLVNTNAGKNLNAWGLNRAFVPRLDVVGKRNLWFAFSLLVILPGMFFVGRGGFKPGIDFTGGSEMTLKFPPSPSVTRAEITKTVAAQGIREPQVQIAEGNTVYVRTPEINQQKADTIVAALKAHYPGVTSESFGYIGSSISTELTRNAFTSILFSSILIVLYLTMRFAIGGFLNGLKFGVCAIIAMLHDVLVLVGVFAILGYFLNWEVDSLFVTAALTVIGFSVHDTIVIFDRIREHLRHRVRGESFEDLVNKSVNETFTRSVNTSLTVLLTLAALLIWGGPVIRPLNVALFIGILSGTYSSIFNAAPLVVVWERLMTGQKGIISPGPPGRARGVPPGSRAPIPPLRPTPGTPSGPANGIPSRGSGTNGAASGVAPDGDGSETRPRPRPNTPPAPRRKRRM